MSRNPFVTFILVSSIVLTIQTYFPFQFQLFLMLLNKSIEKLLNKQNKLNYSMIQWLGQICLYNSIRLALSLKFANVIVSKANFFQVEFALFEFMKLEQPFDCFVLQVLLNLIERKLNSIRFKVRKKFIKLYETFCATNEKSAISIWSHRFSPVCIFS